MIIISDFSKTFTSADTPTTWSVFAKSGILGEDYIRDRDALYEMHYPREVAGDAENTEEWFSQHIELFAKYHLTTEQIDQVVMDDRYFAPRAGVREFLDEIEAQDIALYIVSSGISYFIARWFEVRYDYAPDIIIANELIIEDGVVV
jgi:2-hydroxy-3-keto-5-methylthiopentenyl-1-phosphate phosphatase